MLLTAQVLSTVEVYYGLASSGTYEWNSQEVVLESGLHVRVWIEAFPDSASPVPNIGQLRGAIYDPLGNRVSQVITIDDGVSIATTSQGFDLIPTADGGFSIGFVSFADVQFTQGLLSVRDYTANGNLDWTTQFINSPYADTIAISETQGGTIVSTRQNVGALAFILGPEGQVPPNSFWLIDRIPHPLPGGGTAYNNLDPVTSAQLADGRTAFVVNEANAHDLWLVLVSADGLQVSSRILIADEDGDIYNVQANPLADGSLVIVWHADSASGDQGRFAIVASNGTVSSIYEIAGAANEDMVTATSLADGTLALIYYNSSSGITYLRQYSLTGAEMSQPFIISSSGIPLDAELGLDASLIVTFRNLSGQDQWATRIYLSSFAEVTGSTNPDSLVGTINGERLFGDADDDTLQGLNGDDLLDGGTGSDLLYGGNGTDWYLIDALGDLVFEDAGGGTDTVTSTTNHYLHANVENLVIASDPATFNNPPAIFGVGNALANSIIGSRGANLLLGGGGDDVVSGLDGADSLFGEDGDDILNGDAGIDYLVGGAGHDRLRGDADADALYGEDGDDVLAGGLTFHTDILTGGAGNDTLDGISGQANPDYDLMDGGSGNDTYWVDTGDDLTFEAVGGGTDTVHADVPVANAGVYLYPNVENLVLEGTTAFGVGNELANQLTGSASGNWLLGGAGSDRINGKGGNDVLFGQSGADTFVFGAGSGQDVIGDFSIAEDKIEFATTFTSFAQVQANMVQVGADGAINLGGGNLIVLHGLTMANLTAANFTFAPAAEPPAAPKAALVMEALSLSLELAGALSFPDHGPERWQTELHAGPIFG